MTATDTDLCQAVKPGEGHPQTGIPTCTKPAGHTIAATRPEAGHSAPWGFDGWTWWDPSIDEKAADYLRQQR